MGNGGMNIRWSNKRASLDAAIAVSLLFGRQWRRASEPERWAAKAMQILRACS